jgi:hypothetical protein
MAISYPSRARQPSPNERVSVASFPELPRPRPRTQQVFIEAVLFVDSLKGAVCAKNLGSGGCRRFRSADGNDVPVKQLYIGSARDQESPLLRGKPYALIILVLGASPCDTALITPRSSGWTSGMIL